MRRPLGGTGRIMSDQQSNRPSRVWAPTLVVLGILVVLGLILLTGVLEG